MATTQTETKPEFRALIKEDSKIKPVKQIFAGYEIEKRFLLLTLEEDYTRQKNGLSLYDEILKEGVLIDQGYIKDIQQAVTVLTELGIGLNDFKPNTIRLRKFGPGHKDKKISKYQYVLTLKDRKETKKREVEFRLKASQFEKYWPLTEGSRVQKRRFKKKIKGCLFECDAFTDRLLLIIEKEVDSEEALETVPKIGQDITNDKNWTNKTLSK